MNRSHSVFKHFAASLAGSLVVLSSVAGLAIAEDPLLNTPPVAPVRIPAEFEPMQAVIAAPFVQSPTLYRCITEDVKLIVLYSSAGGDQKLRERLRGFGANMDNCEFYRASYLPIERDGLPWLLYTGDNEPAFVHNQLATSEWSIPQYGLEQGYTVYRSGLSVQGGDFMTDGQGTAVSLDGVAIAHAAMGDEFMERVRDYWGMHTYHFIANEGGKHEYMHIDCLAKFLSPDTVLVARVPSSDVRRERSERAAAYFRRQVSCYGTPYRVVRVDIPNEEPYANSLILNRRVYVPMMDRAADADALASYAAAMPGYEVIGIRDAYEGTTSEWASFIALHCLTMGIADEQMLYIEHTPLLDRPPASQGFPVSARIVALSRTEFAEGTPAVLYRALADANDASSVSWNIVPMASDPGSGDHRYLAYIPAQPVGTVIQYYLQAKDGSGRDETHPYIGEPQAHTFTVTAVGADASAVSASRGGAIEIPMNAGDENARQNYRLTYSLSTDSELTKSLQDVLPDTTVFANFTGQLDDSGIAVARLILSGPLTSDWVGTTLRIALELPDRQDTAMDTVRIQILE